jgi:hypothetical protein
MTNIILQVQQRSRELLVSMKAVLLEQTTRSASNTQMSKNFPEVRSFKEEEDSI